MIEVVNAPYNRLCNCCDDKRAVKEFYFRKHGQGTCVALCADCIKVLTVFLTGKMPEGEAK